MSGVNEDTLLNVRKWLTEEVDTTEFYTHFKGDFRGKSFNSEWHLSAVFSNSPLCEIIKIKCFISKVVYEKIGSAECEIPHICMKFN